MGNMQTRAMRAPCLRPLVALELVSLLSCVGPAVPPAPLAVCACHNHRAVQAERAERRVEAHVEARVREVLQSESVQASLHARLQEARRVMEAEVDAELEAERGRAEAERAAKREAIAAKQRELQELEQQREEQVRRWSWLPSFFSVACDCSLGVCVVLCTGMASPQDGGACMAEQRARLCH